MKGLRQLLVYPVCLALTFASTGCAVFMAAKQPPKKNVTLLKPGTPRDLLLAEFGEPLTTRAEFGKTVDVFSFRQGYSKMAKTGRALFHGVADAATLGLWEVLGTPTEMVFDGTRMAFQVTYDEHDRVEKVAEIHPQQD